MLNDADSPSSGVPPAHSRESCERLTRLARVRRSAILVIIALVTAVSLWTLWPRVSHTFPSMVDDWAAISRSPDQIAEALTLRNPEDLRYRPTWIAWNYLQWHTLGAPDDLRAPLGWGLLRVLALVVGLVAAAAALTERTSAAANRTLTRSLLVGGSAVVVVTIPAIAEDLARYGPQEPLMVGLMCAGGALLWFTVRRSLQGRATTTDTALLGGSAALLWWAGVGQKETSICALVLVPFLWPAVRAHRQDLAALPTGIRRALVATIGLTAAAFVPVLARTVQLASADERVYGAQPNEGILRKLERQVTEMDVELQSRTGWYLIAAAVVLTAVSTVRRRTDWPGVGLVVTAFAFLVFASSTAIVASRYYLPTIALSSLAVARSAAGLPVRVATALASLLVVVGVLQAPSARDVVDGWIGWERKHEEIAREVAEIDGPSCAVDVTGPDVELVEALPVLLPLAGGTGGSCEPGGTFVTVMTGTNPGGEDPNDPPVVACGPSAAEVFRNDVGRILRCS
jgi:hypothetical protein